MSWLAVAAAAAGAMVISRVSFALGRAWRRAADHIAEDHRETLIHRDPERETRNDRAKDTE